MGTRHIPAGAGKARPLWWAQFAMGAAASVKIEEAKGGQDKQIEDMLHSKKKLTQQWKSLDFNGNGMASLAEVDKWIVG